MLELEELKQILREQEEGQTDNSAELERLKLELLRAKTEQQHIKNAQLLKQQEQQEEKRNKRDNKTMLFALIAQLLAALVPFIVLLVLLLKY